MQRTLHSIYWALKRYGSTLWNRNRGYTRFIILGRSRTGSNFLRGLLSSHKQVLVYGEILKNDQVIEWGVDGMPGQGQALRSLQQDPANFLESRVFGPYPAHIQAVGFKLFYYHAQQTALRPAWDYLVGQQTLHVIHLKRRNILRTHLSRKRAEATNQWTNVDGRAEAQPPIELSYDDCLRDFEQTRRWEEEADHLFQDHPMLGLYYEDLVAQLPEQLKRLNRFLGVPPAQVVPQTYPQSHLPLSQSIANFDVLKQRFQGTPWADFFEEGLQGR